MGNQSIFSLSMGEHPTVSFLTYCSAIGQKKEIQIFFVSMGNLEGSRLIKTLFQYFIQF